MEKKSLVVKKLSLENKEIESSNVSLDINSVNFILSSPNKSRLFFKAILGLIETDAKITFFSRPILKSLEYVGYYSESFDIYKDLSIEDFFKYSNSFYKNNYLENAYRMLNIFKLDLKSKIKSLDKSHYELIKIIEAIYHKPELLLLDYPFTYLSSEEIELLKLEIIHLKNEGSTIVIAENRIDILYSISNHYFIFNDNVLTNLKLIKNKVIYFDIIGDLDLKMKLLEINKENDITTLKYLGQAGHILDELSKYNIEIKDIRVGDIL